MKPKNIPNVSTQKTGGFHDTEIVKEFPPHEIETKFKILQKRLFSINRWKEFCNGFSAEFQLCNSKGNPISRKPKRNDYIRIHIPGPTTRKGNGYDWVQIIEVTHRVSNDNEFFMIKCRPSRKPNSFTHRILHFYNAVATSNMMVAKEGNKLRVGIYGRNLKPNFNSYLWDKIRNFFVATGGLSGFGKVQWKLLINGIMNT